MSGKARAKSRAYQCRDDCACPCHDVECSSWWNTPHRGVRCADIRRYIIREDSDDPIRKFLEGL